MVQCRQDIRLALEIADDRVMDDWIAHEIDHLLNCDALDYIGKMHITRTINGSHPSDTDDMLDGIPVNQKNTRLQLVGWFPFYVGLIQALRSTMVIQDDASRL